MNITILEQGRKSRIVCDESSHGGIIDGDLSDQPPRQRHDGVSFPAELGEIAAKDTTTPTTTTTPISSQADSTSSDRCDEDAALSHPRSSAVQSDLSDSITRARRRSRNCLVKEPPPSQSLQRLRPRSSCLRVKTQDESVHSYGLSHHSLSKSSRNASGSTACTAGTDLLHDDTSACASLGLGVSFHTVEVREYPITIGDNPSVIYGPPVAIDWDFDDRIEVGVDEFELCRSSEGRRKGDEMRLDPSAREELVRQSGHTQKDVAEAVRQVGRDRRSRRRSVHNLPIMKFDEVLESGGRKFKRLVLRKKQDDALYREWCRRKAQADSAIQEENEAADSILDIGKEGDMASLTAKAAAISVEEEMALWNTVSKPRGNRVGTGSSASILTTRSGGSSIWPGMKMKKTKTSPVIIEEDSTHHGESFASRASDKASITKS
mmetsp:Transcript_28573/g.63538  ORF Transcript_28573/g.63538 Transcript_28573/m.63538 type:complete len:435 (+) Transcript_28573:85-1389(+)